MRKIASNAECVNVMVGQLYFLQVPIAAFLRLGEAVVLGNLTEVPLPTRFLFVLLAPVVSKRNRDFFCKNNLQTLRIFSHAGNGFLRDWQSRRDHVYGSQVPIRRVQSGQTRTDFASVGSISKIDITFATGLVGCVYQAGTAG